jgi:hypothetical protein
MSDPRSRSSSAATALCIISLATVVNLALPQSGQAQALHGEVVDAGSGAPIADAVVHILDLEGTTVASSRTDAAGQFRIAAPEPGTYGLRVEAVRYSPHALGRIELSGGDPVVVVLRVTAEAVPLEPIEVEGESRVPYLTRAGFYDRMRVETGRFIELSEIEERNPRRIVDMLRGIAGVRILESGHAADVVLRGGLASRVGFNAADAMCAPEVYLDGTLISRGSGVGRGGGIGDGRYNLNEIVPENIEAIEVYASAARVPARFGGAHASCGVVLFWSRS